jgi:DNA-directed RNA polymerase specialized sigma24 family protein
VASPQGDDERLGGALRAGDESALADAYARWSPLVYSLALRSLDDVAMAEEVTRRVFTQAWVRRETFDPARTRLSVWLVGLARVSIADVRATSTEESTQAESKTGALGEVLVVADEMSHLDTRSGRVLKLAHAEIAERTGLRVEEVRSAIATSLMNLRQRLEVRADAHRS